MRVLELGSGQGDFARDVIGVCPDAQILGLDLAREGLRNRAQQGPERIVLPARPDAAAGAAGHVPALGDARRLLRGAGARRRSRGAAAQRPPVPRARLPSGGDGARRADVGVRSPHGPSRALPAPAPDRRVSRRGPRHRPAARGRVPVLQPVRLVVIARGKALIRDVDASASALPLSARLVMRGFDRLFKWNQDRSQRGWQLVARALEPARAPVHVPIIDDTVDVSACTGRPARPVRSGAGLPRRASRGLPGGTPDRGGRAGRRALRRAVQRGAPGSRPRSRSPATWRRSAGTGWWSAAGTRAPTWGWRCVGSARARRAPANRADLNPMLAYCPVHFYPAYPFLGRLLSLGGRLPVDYVLLAESRWPRGGCSCSCGRGRRWCSGWASRRRTCRSPRSTCSPPGSCW